MAESLERLRRPHSAVGGFAMSSSFSAANAQIDPETS
jgi:hypothetical protein